MPVIDNGHYAPEALPLEVDGISHTYPAHSRRRGHANSQSLRQPKRSAPLPALADVSFSVGAAEIFGLLGPNGGGKTTLFRILSTLMRPQSGTARVFGFDLLKNAHDVRRHIGIVFQSSSVDGKLTAGENMRHQGRLYGMSGAPLERKLRELLDRVALADRIDDPAEVLSGGQRRRLELAKGLLHSPRLLLLDEPTTGLDPIARRDLWSYFNILREAEDISVLVTTHLMEEAEYCDRLAIIHHGRLVALGTPDQLKREIEGDVLILESRDPERLSRSIADRYRHQPRVVGRSLRIELPDASNFVPLLMQSFHDDIESVTVARPTLEDVFIHRTGERITGPEPVAATELQT